MTQTIDLNIIILPRVLCRPGDTPHGLRMHLNQGSNQEFPFIYSLIEMEGIIKKIEMEGAQYQLI